MERSLSVLHVSTAQTWRGGEQQIAYLIKGLEQLGVHSHLICSAGSEIEQYGRREKLAMDALYKGWSFNPLFSRGIAKLAKTGDFDLVHVHDAHAHTFAVLAHDLFGSKLPIVLSRRVDFPIKDKKFSRYKYNHERIKAILCVSDAIRQIMLPDIDRPEILNTVHSGIDFSRFDGTAADGRLRRSLDLSDNCTLIGNIAALAPHKDLLTFVNAADLLLKEGLDLHFVIMGEGSERSAVEDRIKQLGLRSKISLLGFRNDLAIVLKELDLMMVSSETEGLGTSILDAMYCRVPVVATQAGGIVELIKHEKTGLLSPINRPDKLASNVMKLLSKDDLKQELVQNAFEDAKRFSYEQTAQKTLKYYKRVIGVK